jgi:hypothetical protein
VGDTVGGFCAAGIVLRIWRCPEPDFWLDEIMPRGFPRSGEMRLDSALNAGRRLQRRQSEAGGGEPVGPAATPKAFGRCGVEQSSPQLSGRLDAYTLSLLKSGEGVAKGACVEPGCGKAGNQRFLLRDKPATVNYMLLYAFERASHNLVIHRT